MIQNIKDTAANKMDQSETNNISIKHQWIFQNQASRLTSKPEHQLKNHLNQGLPPKKNKKLDGYRQKKSQK